MASFPGEETKRPPLLSTPVPFTTSVANATLKHLAVFEYNPLQLEAVRFASTFRAGVLDTQDIFGDFYRYLPINLEEDHEVLVDVDSKLLRVNLAFC